MDSMNDEKIDYRTIIIQEILEAPEEIINGFYSGKKCQIYLRDNPEISLAFIIGMRRIGKTEFYTWLQCHLYQKYGIKTAWIRNREIEFKKNYESFLNNMHGRNLIPESWIVKSSGVYSDTGKNAIKIIDFVYLNTASNMRGGGHPDTYLMIMDEFQPEDLRYPSHPLQSLMSLTQTILSGKSSLCFCLSNFVSLANPYFVGMEIYPRKQDITVFPEKGVLIERCRGYRRAIQDSNPWTRVYQTAGYMGYASETEDGLLELVAPAPKGAKAADSIVFCIHGRYYRRLQDRGLIFWIRTNEPNPSYAMIMTPYQEDVTTTIHPCSKGGYRSILEQGIQGGKMRFQSPNALFDLMSPIYLV